MSTFDPTTMTGAQVVGPDGEKLGKIADVYLDNHTSKPEWAAVKSGLFGGHVSMVPLAHAEFEGDSLTVPYSKEQIKNAPHQDPDEELSEKSEAALFEHYGVPYGGETVTAQTGGQGGQESGQQASGQSGQRRDRAGEAGVQGQDTSGPTTDKAMTRSEEQLHVGTEQVHGGTARLRKYVTSEDVTQTVPVRHEEVRVEREPITDANRGDAMSGGDLSEEEHEVTLHAEKPVVHKETVPVERVRLGTETVIEEHTVNETVRKEHIEEPPTNKDK